MLDPTAAPDQDATLGVADPMEHPDYESLVRLLGQSTCRALGIYKIPDDLVLSVVIPVFNEMKTIEEIVRQVRAVPIPNKQVILVDDCSKDGTTDLLRRWQA